MAKEKLPAHLYPTVTIPRITNPNRFYAFPILGGLVKCIILIPVFFWLLMLGIAFYCMSIINSFVVLFTRAYWRPAYEIGVLVIHISAKIYYFFYGLTNRYPGFTGETKDFTIEIPYPTQPSIFFAIPIVGGLARCILLIPFLLYISVIQYAGEIGAVAASFPVLFMGTYPESLYEIGRDTIRLNLATVVYYAGFADKYPSWWISMHHKSVKVTLIILATLLFLLNAFNKSSQQSQYRNYAYPTPTSNSTY